MDLINLCILLAMILAMPRLASWACLHSKALGFLGSSLLCFAAGIALSFVLPDTSSASALSDWCVCLAIPFMLFSLNVRFLRKLAKPAVVSFLLICLCVVAAGVAGHYLFRRQLGRSSAAVNSSLVGLFIGGLVNMAAVGSGLHLSGDTLTLLNTSYIVTGSVYLGITAVILPPVARLFLPKYRSGQSVGDHEAMESMASGAQPFRWSLLWQRLPVMLLAVAIVLGSMGISQLLTGNSQDAIVKMLCITTLSLLCSFIPRVRQTKGSYAVGQYLIDMFCVAMGLMFDLSAEGSAGPIVYMLLMLFLQAAAAVLHLLLAKLFRIDADTALITSAAAIFSPAFIPPIAQFMKNRELVAVGLLFSILGFVVANYAGFVTYALLTLLP